MSKIIVKALLKEAGKEHLFSEDNYKEAVVCTRIAEKKYPNLKQLFKDLEGTKQEYMRDLIIKNCDK